MLNLISSYQKQDVEKYAIFCLNFKLKINETKFRGEGIDIKERVILIENIPSKSTSQARFFSNLEFSNCVSIIENGNSFQSLAVGFRKIYIHG